MDIRQRLADLQGLSLIRSERRSRPAKGESVAGYLGGSLVSGSHGEYIQIDKSFKPSHHHGSICLSDLTSVDRETSRFIQKDQSTAVDLSRTVFLDTETTGLSGGSGTCAFLIGVGYFTGNGFMLRQFFMQDYDQEKPALQALSGLLSDFSHIVTYNGKSYDLPLLGTRYVLNRIKSPLKFDSHLDLLFPARRIWKRRLKDCSLSNLENKVLGVERAADIPSYLIPQAYFDFLRSGELNKLHYILDHNSGDILSLAALLLQVSRLVNNPQESDSAHQEELLSLGLHFYYAREWDKAGQFFDRAVKRVSGNGFYLDAYLLKGRLYKRQGKWQEAQEVWKHIISENRDFCLEPHLELAKFYEHRARDLKQALVTVERLLERLELDFLKGNYSPLIQGLDYRKARILRKLRT
ncbi:MAG: ribonuclease H-like domain-containing protein [candidate division Zixibacteria bacterium]|nr:ribonuclease H-like domain-containing protein [candidate division Zixibacteria bacterium]